LLLNKIVQMEAERRGSRLHSRINAALPPPRGIGADLVGANAAGRRFVKAIEGIFQTSLCHWAEARLSATRVLTPAAWN